MSGVSLLQGFRNTGVQEHRSTGVQKYQRSGNCIIIMPSPRKSDNHEYAMQVPGIIVSSQVSQYQVNCTSAM